MEKVEQRNQIDYYEGMIIGKRGNAKNKITRNQAGSKVYNFFLINFKILP